MCSHNTDPESLDWDLLDKDFQENLDAHHYFSLSGHTTRTAQKTLQETSTASTTPPTTNIKPEPLQIDYTTLDLDSDHASSSADETEIPEGSLFDYHVPGIMTKEEVVEKLDLDTWKLRVRNDFVEMRAVTGWERSLVTDPQSVKGIVAELAAALGEEVVCKGGSAVDLF